MCLVRSWKTGFAAMCKAAWLSQYNKASLEWLTLSSFNKDNNQVSLQVALAIDLYSTSAEDQENVACFLDFQEINESPKNTQ